ncbi:MAG: pilus assembly PilX N-terminal domain-containing protein [Acidobacteriota bacterium]
MAGLSILGVSLMMVSDTELHVSNDERLRKQALYAAEAGIEHALVYLRNVDTKATGAGSPYSLMINGNVAYNAATQPPDELASYNEPIVVADNLFDPARPWLPPALARKGNVLEYQANPIWFPQGGV